MPVNQQAVADDTLHSLTDLKFDFQNETKSCLVEYFIDYDLLYFQVQMMKQK